MFNNKEQPEVVSDTDVTEYISTLDTHVTETTTGDEDELASNGGTSTTWTETKS